MVDTAYTEGFKAGIAWEKAHRDEMQPFDIPSGIAFNKGYYRRQGRKQEQERIIKLLEAELSQDLSESAGYIMDKENYPVRWVRLIALIKGEK